MPIAKVQKENFCDQNFQFIFQCPEINCDLMAPQRLHKLNNIWFSFKTSGRTEPWTKEDIYNESLIARYFSKKETVSGINMFLNSSH